MKISTKGRYALRVMIDLAQHQEMGMISLKDIAARQEVSMKYLEMIVGILLKEEFVVSQRGKAGGYKLAKSPSQYSIGSILRVAEGSLSPVQCIEQGIVNCEKAADCITLPLWRELDAVIDRFLESVSLEDLIAGRIEAGGSVKGNDLLG